MCRSQSESLNMQKKNVLKMKTKAENTRPKQSKHKFKQVWGASLRKSCLSRYDLCVALSSTLKIYSWRGISMREERAYSLAVD